MKSPRVASHLRFANPIVTRGYLFGALVVAAVVSALGTRTWADPTAPSADDRQVAKAVTWLLQKEHLLRKPLDKELSQRCLKQFLKALDPWKVYFYQSDVDAMMKHQDELADAIKRGDVSFAYAVFKTFLQRVDERVRTVDELLAMQHDFTVDEEMDNDKDKAVYARDPAEAKEKWRRRIKCDLLVLKLEKTEGKDAASKSSSPTGTKPGATPETGVVKEAPRDAATDGKDAVDKLRQRYHSFAKRMHQTNGEDLLEIYLTAFTTGLDPHTDYMSPASLEDFQIAMKLELEGIGAALQSVDGYTVINKLIPGGAAERDKRLKEEDKIVAVGQDDDGEMVDTIDMKLRDVVKMIRGKQGTVVRLGVVSVGSSDRKNLKLTREKIELKDSEARGQIFEVGHKADGAPFKVGVIDLPSFYMDMEGARRGLPDYKSTTRDVRLILDGFNSKGVDAVVLDLRRDGGGSLTEAINLTGLFIKDGPVVQVKGPDGPPQPYYDLDPGISWAGPLMVLTSKLSASASEIFAGAIQDYKRGLIVGDQATHGKGTVQSLLDLGQQIFGVPNAKPMGALKVTMQQFYRPLVDSTQKRGVLADVELPSLTTHMDIGEADLDYPIPFDRVKPLSFKGFALVNKAMCEQLSRLSEERRSHVEKFQKLAKDIDRYEEQKARKTVTLNEEKFLKERADMNADKEEEKKLEGVSNSKNTGIERDFYLDEVLAITVDYINSLQPPLAQAR
jgi:carboxyl-terminal processing protease